MKGALRSFVVLAVAGLMLGSATASAQKAENVQRLIEHMAGGLTETKVGDWVTYKVAGDHDERVSYWRVAVVGEEKDKLGRDAFWVEIELGTHPAMVAPLFQTKVLVAQHPAPGTGAITRMYMAWGVEKVRELDDAAMKKMSAPPDPPTSDGTTPHPEYVRVNVGTEKRLMTLAGTVTAVPTEIHAGQVVVKRIWMSREIPLLHLAKLELPPVDYAIEIRDYGRDAKPRMILPVDGAADKLSFEGGGLFGRTTLFPDQVNEAMAKEREGTQKEGEPHAH